MKVDFFSLIESSITISQTMPMVRFMSPNLGYKFSMSMTLMHLYCFKNGYKILLLEFETHRLMLNCMSSHKGLFLYVSLATIV